MVGIDSGILFGGALLVLLDEYRVLYATREAMIAVLVGGALLGIVVPSFFALFRRR